MNHPHKVGEGEEESMDPEWILGAKKEKTEDPKQAEPFSITVIQKRIKIILICFLTRKMLNY